MRFLLRPNHSETSNYKSHRFSRRTGLKFIHVWGMSFFIAALFCSCATNAGTGVIAGGTVGAGAGALVSGGGGALLGSAIGVLGVGLIGAGIDEQDRKLMEKSSPRTIDRMDRGEPLTINDVIKLSQSGVNSETIIGYMQNTHSVYNLSQTQIRRLQDAGVSSQVIDYMIDAKM